MWLQHGNYRSVSHSGLSRARFFAISWTAASKASFLTPNLRLAQTYVHELSRWGHPTISSSAIPFSSCLQSLPAWGSFLMSRLFESGGQSIGASASASVLSMNIQDWSPVGLTGLISLQCKGLSRVFSSTTVWKHQLFGTQPSLWSNPHIRR